MDEKPIPEPVPLSHEDLRAMLATHALYNATEGKEGQKADFSLRVIEDFDFSGLDLCDSNDPIHAAVFVRCRFVGTDFYFMNFYDVSAVGGDFQGALFPKAEFHGGDFSGANFDGANLFRANLFGCNLRGATFRGADLNMVSFGGSDVEGAVFDEGIVPDID